MSLVKFRYAPQVDGYTIKPADQLSYIYTDGGAPRKRLRQLNGWDSLNVTWFLHNESYLYFMAFYQGTTKYGSLNFYLDLQINNFEMEQYEVCFVPSSIQVNNLGANNIKVSCSLLVKPNTNLLGADYVSLINEFGENYSVPLDLLDLIINTNLPNDLPA